MFPSKSHCVKLNFFSLQAPCEAEASCAALVKGGKVFATATEDMDGLTFGTNVLLRHLTASEAKYGCSLQIRPLFKSVLFKLVS